MNGEKHSGNIGWIIGIVSIAIVMAVAMTIIGTMNVTLSKDKIEKAGYIVLAAGEYDALLALLQDVDTKADDAVVNAEAAALAAQETLDTLRLHTENENFLFPDTTNVSVTLTAPATANTWGNWTEIAGNDTVTFSSKFTDSDGYITQMTGYGYNFSDELIIIEIAYDDDGTDVVGRAMMRSDFTWVLELNSEPIPEDSTVYYRMMSSHINETLKANFKYYYN